jgi:hypothetical protein
MAHAVKAEEAFDMVHVALLGSRRVVADAQSTPHPIEEARGLGKGQLAQIDMQEALIEEVQSLARLFEGSERIGFGLGEVFEEAADLEQTQFAGMAFVVKEDEAAGPITDALTGLGPAEVDEGGLTKLVEQARGLGYSAGRIGRGYGIDHG